MPRLLDQLRQKGAQIPIFSTNKTGIKRKEDEFRQSLSNGSHPRDVHVPAPDGNRNNILLAAAEDRSCREWHSASSRGPVESRRQPNDPERSKANQPAAFRSLPRGRLGVTLGILAFRFCLLTRRHWLCFALLVLRCRSLFLPKWKVIHL